MDIEDILTFGYAEKEKTAEREFKQLSLMWQEWETEAKAYDQSREKLNETISKILSVCKEKDFQERSDIVLNQYGELLQNNTSVLKDKASEEYVPMCQAFRSTNLISAEAFLFSSLVLGATDAWGMLGGVCTALIVFVVMIFISYSKMKKYETSITEIKNALEKASSVETIKQRKEKMNRLNDDFENKYRDYEQGKISAEKLYDFLMTLSFAT